MLRSDWLCYYYAVCYSPLVAQSAGFLAADTVAHHRVYEGEGYKRALSSHPM